MIEQEKYIKIEAFCYNGDLDLDGNGKWKPDWIIQAIKARILYSRSVIFWDSLKETCVNTPMGTFHIKTGDYFIGW